MECFDHCLADLSKKLNCCVKIEHQYQNTDYALEYLKKGESVSFYINNNDSRDQISRFKLSGLNGCNEICVSSDSYVDPKYRNKGVATRLNSFRKEFAIAAGFSILLCTDRSDNIEQRKLLKRNCWKDIYSFKNKDGNEVNISIFNLKKLMLFA